MSVIRIVIRQVNRFVFRRSPFKGSLKSLEDINNGLHIPWKISTLNFFRQNFDETENFVHPWLRWIAILERRDDLSIHTSIVGVSHGPDAGTHPLRHTQDKLVLVFRSFFHSALLCSGTML